MRAVPRAASAWPSDAAGSSRARAGPAVVIDRLVRKAEFERALRNAPQARSPLFALHHAGAVSGATQGKLSTDEVEDGALAVDDSGKSGRWLGLVVPKRHARRSVTRSLVKRAMRHAAERHAATLPAGVWVLRLRQTIDRSRFPSAASAPLAQLVAAELEQLMCAAERRP